MEKQQYILKFPLKQLALIKVAIGLWNQDDVLSSMKKPPSDDKSLTNSPMREWANTLIMKVKEKVPTLLLPDPLREELIHLIPPIGSEMLRWKLHHRFLISSDATDVLDQICWTSQGTVDYRETAVRLIRQERVDIVSSYKLACLYCLDDNIQAIWGKLSEDDKACFYNKEDPGHFQRQNTLVTFWTCSLNGDTNILNFLYNARGRKPERTLFQEAFECEAMSGNKVATEYFFQKLTFEEREASLVKTAALVAFKRWCKSYEPHDFPPENFSAVVCYLLPQMSEEEQMEIFKGNVDILRYCFLHWPFQNLFMKLAGLVWPFLSVSDYQRLLKSLISNCRMSVFNHEKLFREFFLQSPSHFRNSALDMERNIFWVANLFRDDKTECMKFVLRNLVDEVKERFVISPFAVFLWIELINEEKWSAIELFIKECTLSDEAKTSLKEDASKNFTFFSKRGKREISEREREKFFQLIDNANIRVCNKRCIEAMEGGEQHTSTAIKGNAEEINLKCLNEK
ncbi:hypothetical protein AVEN_212540-1 [Araneus ventricosus]|uniref:Uncharacterized protein n=1 Tax=Araneus ventricosus TaxID=182803 RepID=A0A4Y2JSX7_ARAVE|nr:hypothetical protein AVEN_212540-1 [Araneus ventricosus]